MGKVSIDRQTITASKRGQNIPKLILHLYSVFSFDTIIILKVLSKLKICVHRFGLLVTSEADQ